MFSSSPLISASLSMQWFFNGQTWQKMFRLSVRGLPSNKHVHLKCLLNQGSKTPEPPQTQQTTVESDCYSCKSSTSPPQNLWWPIVFITFGSFYFIYKCFFFQIPLACFSHLQNVQSFLKNTTQNPGERVPCFPPVSRVDGTFGLPPLNLAEDCWGWRT